MNPETFIRVKYEYVDDHHVFTSEDVRGLLVVSKDARTAFKDVAISIQHLLELNEGIKCNITPLKPFHDFLSERRKKNVSENGQDQFDGFSLSNQSYAISACA